MKKITMKLASRCFHFFKTSSLLLIPLLFYSISTFGQNPAGNLDQIRNGSAASPDDPANWVNGNAGPSNAHFAEGYSIPYRLHITGLSSGSHVAIIEWDTKHGNGHAIDYITHYSNLDNPAGSHQATFKHDAEIIDPTIGISGLGAVSTFPILPPSSVGSERAGQPTASFNALGATDMTIYGGTITAMKYLIENNPDGSTAQTVTRLSITFTTTNTQVLLAWGGHIAAEYDWGPGRGATGVSGSPYHTRLISIDGSGGNQDRSLKASAVIIPPPVCGISAAQLACPETASLTFDATGSSTGLNISYVWTINSGNTAGAKINGSNTGFSISVVPIGADFIAGGTFNLSLQVNKTGTTPVTCSLSPAGTIQKVVVNASANPTSFDLAVRNTSQLNASLSGSDVTDPLQYTLLWSQSPPAGGSLSSTSNSNPVFTATAPGSYTFTVTATQKADPSCSATSSVTVVVTSSTPPCAVSGPSPICPSTTNSYVYDPTGDGNADPIPTNFTAVWTLENNTNNAVKSGSPPHTGNSVSVVAGATCNTSYRIRITLTSTSGLITATCFKDVTVNDVLPPTITNCPADVVIECNASSVPASTGTATATDNCSASVGFNDVTTPGCFTIIQRTWTATDPCGNTATCVQRIIKRDRTAPNITCPASGPATATDNCSATANINIFFRDAGTTRTWTAVDESGNISTCLQTISPPPAPAPNVEQAPVIKKADKKQVSIEIDNGMGLKVNAYPNPYSNVIIFKFDSQISGNATLEVYNIVGQRIGQVYKGEVEAGVQKTIQYTVPVGNKVPIIYRLSVGDKSLSGKMIPSEF